MVNWDPKPHERTYYRSTVDGQRAYLVKRDGVDCIRLDRPMEELIVKLDGSWVKDAENHPISAHQAARVAFIADRALCSVIGEHIEAKQEWIDVKEKERIRFMKDGPDTGDVRDDLFRAIMGVLRELTDG